MKKCILYQDIIVTYKGWPFCLFFAFINTLPDKMFLLISDASSGNIQREHLPIQRQNSYEEDPEITAQIHLTLADLDANLAGK